MNDDDISREEFDHMMRELDKADPESPMYRALQAEFESDLRSDGMPAARAGLMAEAVTRAMCDNISEFGPNAGRVDHLLSSLEAHRLALVSETVFQNTLTEEGPGKADPIVIGRRPNSAKSSHPTQS